ALTGRFRVVKAALDDLFRLTRGTRNAVEPAQLADGLITLHIIDEILHVDLHGWTPVRDRGLRGRQYTPPSNATTPESNKSVAGIYLFGGICKNPGLPLPSRSTATAR